MPPGGAEHPHRIATILAPLSGALRASQGLAHTACRFWLPPCPTSNNLYPQVRTPKGTIIRVKSASYKDWLQKAERQFNLHGNWDWPAEPLDYDDARKGTLLHRWAYHQVVAVPRWGGSGDADGYLKAPIDFWCAQTGLQDRHLVQAVSHKLEVYMDIPRGLYGCIYLL